MDKKWNDIIEGLEGFGKFFLFGIVWIVSLIGKFSMDILRGRVFTWKIALAELGLALFVPFIVGMLCADYVSVSRLIVLVSLSTYLSGKIALIIWNWKGLKKYIHDTLDKNVPPE